MDLTPGWAKGKPAKYGTFTSGVVMTEQGAVLVANCGAYEDEQHGGAAALRRSTLRSLTEGIVAPMHRAYERTFSKQHCAMLASAARASIHPRLTLANEAWSATQLDWNVSPPLASRTMERFSVWQRAEHDDAFLPSIHVSMPPSTPSSSSSSQGAVVSSLGFYFLLPKGASTYIVQRAFPFMLIPARVARGQDKGSADTSLIVTASVDSRIISSSCSDRAPHDRCIFAQGAAAHAAPWDLFEAHLSDAIASPAKALAWLSFHATSHLKHLQREAARPSLLVAAMDMALTESSRNLQAQLDCNLKQLASQLDFNPEAPRAAVSESERHVNAQSAVQAFAVIANSNIGITTKLASSCAQAIETWKRRRLPEVQRFIPEVVLHIEAAPSSTLPTQPRQPRTGRVAKKRKLGFTSEQLLLLSSEVPLTTNDNTALTVSDLAPGPTAVQQLIDERSTRLRASASAASAVELEPPSSEQHTTLSSRIQADQHIGELFKLEHLASAVALKCQIRSLIAAYAFYEDLEAYSVRLAALVGRTFDSLVLQHSVDEPVARLMVHICEVHPSLRGNSAVDPSIREKVAAATAELALTHSAGESVRVATGGLVEQLPDHLVQDLLSISESDKDANKGDTQLRV